MYYQGGCFGGYFHFAIFYSIVSWLKIISKRLKQIGQNEINVLVRSQEKVIEVGLAMKVDSTQGTTRRNKLSVTNFSDAQRNQSNLKVEITERKRLTVEIP